MLQFYFLSILFNLAAGIFLVWGKGTAVARSVVAADGGETAAGQESQDPAASGEERTADGTDGAPDTGSACPEFFRGRTFRLVLGILTALTGVMKLLSVVRTDVPVVGDLIPALAGLAGGFCILLDYYVSESTEKLPLPAWISCVFVRNSRYIGYFCLCAAVLHFVFPDVIFL